MDSDRRTATERWFLRRGIPHFIVGYSATEDVWTRAAPLLALVFLGELLGAVNLDWPWWANVMALAGGVAILATGWVAANRVRGRGRWQRPDDIGWIELSVFVLVPALLPLVFGGQARAAAWTVAANLTILAVVYVGTSYAFLPLTRWAGSQAARQLGGTVALFARALPLLLLGFTFLFINAEVWQLAGSLDGRTLAVALSLFAILGVLFILVRLPAELAGLGSFPDPAELEATCAGTPVEGVPAPAADVPSPSGRQWGNLALVVVFRQGIQILIVAALIGLFFVAFGSLTVSEATVAAWIGSPADVVASVEIGGIDLVVSTELIRVAMFLAGFAGLYFAVYAVHDPSFRAEFYEDVTSDVRTALAVRRIYLSLIRSG